jgi:hypothetical protein
MESAWTYTEPTPQANVDHLLCAEGAQGTSRSHSVGDHAVKLGQNLGAPHI